MTDELIWSSDISRSAQEEMIVMARLPDGPIWVAEGTAMLLVEQMVGLFSPAELASWAVEAFDGDPDEIAAGTLEYIASLVQLGVLVPAVTAPEAIAR